jgi:hypothetical protein
MSNLILEHLRISRHWKGHMEGTIKFKDGDSGSEVTVVIDEDKINDVLKVVADSVVAAAQAVAADLTHDIIEQAGPALPAPEGGSDDRRTKLTK